MEQKIVRLQAVILKMLAAKSYSNPARAITRNEIIRTVGFKTAPQTIYVNLKKLKNYGFVKNGIPCGREATYYITKAGEEYIQNIVKGDE